jgi:hypothetical protein
MFDFNLVIATSKFSVRKLIVKLVGYLIFFMLRNCGFLVMLIFLFKKKVVLKLLSCHESSLFYAIE